jgi:hypothetical protein
MLVWSLALQRLKVNLAASNPFLLLFDAINTSIKYERSYVGMVHLMSEWLL